MTTMLQRIRERAAFSEHQAYYRLGYDSEKEPGVSKIIEGARGENQSLLPLIEAMAQVIEKADNDLRHIGEYESTVRNEFTTEAKLAREARASMQSILEKAVK